jgi:hypothetical protein
VLASMRGSFRAVWLPPGLDAYWYAYQETGDLHRESSSKDKDVERADSYCKDHQDLSHRHRLGVTINQQRPRSTS